MTDPMANLAPLQSPRKSGASPTLSPKAAEFLGKVTVAADFAPHLDHSYVVKHWLNSTTMSVIYGDSNVGKTFFALDLARHVAGGIEWNGCRVAGGPVLYIAAEGGHGFGNRVAAIKDRLGLQLWILPISVDLCKTDADTPALIEMIKRLSENLGSYVLIVVDTLARSMGNGDENASPDMGAFVRNLDRLRAETGAHVMVIHCRTRPANGLGGCTWAAARHRAQRRDPARWTTGRRSTHRRRVGDGAGDGERPAGCG